MSKSNDVRFTRDGDQFHYLWAARRCLKLLSPTTSLVAITIEGASKSENPDGKSIAAGEEVIDVGEYYGSTNLSEAKSVHYFQLKHSTVQTSVPWTMSGLETTLAGFAKRFSELRQVFGDTTTAQSLSFVFATNRPISSDVFDAIEDARNETAPRNAQATRGLSQYTGLKGKDLAAFCSLLSLESEFSGFLEQRSALANDLRGYLAGGDSEAFLQIKELVTRKATSEFIDNPSITKLDLLRALGRDENDLFPANNLITLPELIIPRQGEESLVRSIIDAGSAPVIVHAEGGVGKSVFASKIGSYLPEGSLTIVYDCFGNGQYREPSHPRHGARQALVQIANELASKSMCHPIIPSAMADDASYFRAFRSRIEQVVNSIQQEHAGALLCIAIDAADNAEMAAEESGVPQSFARSLLREPLPDGVRLVMLCRTHRRYRLKPPPTAVELVLQPFTWAETASKLRGVFPNADDHDVTELHRLSSQNPRVQATALATARDLQGMLRDLGPEPKSVDDMIGAILSQAIMRAKEEVPTDLHPQFDRICTALAVLRPMVPLAVVSSLTQMEPEILRSFLADFGQSIIIKGALLQFRDEPTESWFQNQFKPTEHALRDFITLLRPQAATSSYVAATLPHLLMRAGQLDELIKIALSSSDLPESSTLERREVEAQRLHFAVRASLRSKRYSDAAKLGLAAANLAATEERQWETIQKNADLAAHHLDPEQILSVVSAKEFSGGWTGAHHVYDACILSHIPAFQGDAQSHIRMAIEWLRSIRALPPEEREKERVEPTDLSDLALAHLNVYGAERASAILGRCRGAEFRYGVACSMANRLVDAGRLDELDAIAKYGSNDTALVAALVVSAARVGHLLPSECIQKAWKNIARISPQSKERNFDSNSAVPTILTAFAWTVVKMNLYPRSHVSTILARHLGTDRLRALGYSHEQSAPTIIKAYVLKTILMGGDCSLMDLAHPEWHEALTKGGYSAEEDTVRKFRARARALLPWYRLWTDVHLNNVLESEVSQRIAAAEKESSSGIEVDYREKHQLKNACALAYVEVLCALGESAHQHIKLLQEKLSKSDYYLGTRIQIVWLVARCPSLKSLALEISNKAAILLDATNEQAESRVDSWISLSRALLSAHDNESRHFFQKSMEVAAKLGDENLWRWGALIHLANSSASQHTYAPELAYRLSRAAELSYEFVYRDKHFDWTGTVQAIADLCPLSAFAILSRWRDRNFGSCQRTLAILVKHLASKGRITSELTAALYGFQADWGASEMFALALDGAESDSSRLTIAEHLYRYFQVEKINDASWREIRQTAKRHHIELAGVEDFVANSQCIAEVERVHKQRSSPTSKYEKVPIDWDDIFANVDVATLPGLIESISRLQALSAYDNSSFYEQAAARIPVGKESEFLTSLNSYPKFELYELKLLVQSIPAGWRNQFSTMTALQLLVKNVISRNAFGISTNRYYQTLPLDLVARETGLEIAELVDVALKAQAEADVELGAESLFQLVGLLALRLNSGEAAEALDFELTHLESSMEDDVGDGVWKCALYPSKDIDSAVAGYTWAALAVPEADYRWQAAHVVRALCALKCTSCVDSLVNWLDTSAPTQYMDHKFVHYALHAKLWLLIGFARAAQDDPSNLRNHYSSLVGQATNGETHVLIRGFAARASISIATAGLAEPNPTILATLGSINAPILSPDAPTRIERLRQNRGRKNSARQLDLHFGIDFPSYWFDPLATRFGLSSDDVCLMVQDVILNRMSMSVAQWRDDQRYKQNYYDYEVTRHSHGSYPKSEDLHFYLSFHAMMMVAGELLAKIPLTNQESERDDFDTFEYWLREYELTLADGRWLADRRDPQPFELPPVSLDGDDQTWRWSLSKVDFERILLAKPGMISVSGRWLQVAGYRREEVSISSALVSAESAQSLLIALQTASDLRFTPGFPRAQESDIEAVPGHELVGWIINEERSDALDSKDPWGADIHTPPLLPSTAICEMLGIATDASYRNWHQLDDHALAMTSRTWSSPQPYHERENDPSHGLLLQASTTTLNNLIAKSNMYLIFKISISRRLSSTYYRDEDDAAKYPSPYVLYFLMDKNEEFTTL